MLYDIAIIGGGINGVGIALEAISRGLSVMLCEQYDLASGTSSKSSKLAHGGIRYLEQFAFSLVKESLRERDNLLQNAPHLVHALPFIIPLDRKCRSPLLLQMGLFCYDFLNFKRKTQRSKKIKFEMTDKCNPVKRSIHSGFQYYDCQVDDARLVISIAQKAHSMGAQILTRTALIDTRYHDQEYWTLRLQEEGSPDIFEKRAKVLINATGPWIESTIHKSIPIKTQYELKLVKGSHIIVPKLYEEQAAYLLQHIDGRVVFVIPYYEQFTLIGTTDMPHTGKIEETRISRDEINYLCHIVNHYFHHSIKPQDIVQTYAGVRALWNDHSANLASISRECKIETIVDETHPTLINIYGGKLTTYRSLGEKVINELHFKFPKLGPSQTRKLKLPGAFKEKTFKDFFQKLTNDFHWLPQSVIKRLAKCYGETLYDIFKDCQTLESLGRHFGYGLYEKEVWYLMEKEWVKTVDDILWRRTKLGLYFREDEKKQLAHYVKMHQSEVFVLNQSAFKH